MEWSRLGGFRAARGRAAVPPATIPGIRGQLVSCGNDLLNIKSTRMTLSPRSRHGDMRKSCGLNHSTRDRLGEVARADPTSVPHHYRRMVGDQLHGMAYTSGVTVEGMAGA